jgi:hypothetical protein
LVIMMMMMIKSGQIPARSNGSNRIGVINITFALRRRRRVHQARLRQCGDVQRYILVTHGGISSPSTQRCHTLLPSSRFFDQDVVRL